LPERWWLDILLFHAMFVNLVFIKFFFRIKILGTAWTEEFSTIMDF
jgi:hypothetical protein